jgi:hypothetical protein
MSSYLRMHGLLNRLPTAGLGAICCISAANFMTSFLRPLLLCEALGLFRAAFHRLENFPQYRMLRAVAWMEEQGCTRLTLEGQKWPTDRGRYPTIQDAKASWMLVGDIWRSFSADHRPRTNGLRSVCIAWLARSWPVGRLDWL